MPVSLQNLRQQRRSVAVDVVLDVEGGELREVVNVVYNPGAITERMLDDLREAQAEEDENALNGMLSRLCIGWDVMGEDGAPIPFRNGTGPHPDLSLVPIPFKSLVLSRIMEDASPNRPSAGTSGDGLRRKGK